MERAEIPVLFALAALACACGRHVDLERDPNGIGDGSAGSGGILIDAPNERILPDGPVPVIEDSGLSLDAGDGCAARLTGCPSVTDFPCGQTQWFSRLVSQCREQVGCVQGFLTLRIAGEGCVSEIGMTHENRPFVECLVRDLAVKRCPCPPLLDTLYLGEACP
jgi:hypothetical protein